MHVMDGKPFFVIGLSALLLSTGFRIWRARVEQEKQAGIQSSATKWLGWVLKAWLVLTVLLVTGVIGWMVWHS